MAAPSSGVRADAISFLGTARDKLNFPLNLNINKANIWCKINVRAFYWLDKV